MSKAHPSPLSKERKQQYLNWTSLNLDTWFWEWLSIAFSVACFITTVGLLLVYHNSPSPNPPHGLTLNTIVSVLATASKASLLLTIGTSIGQLKWIWFQQGPKRQLYNLQSFDDASRGPLGSLKILFQRQQQGRLLLSLAAVVTLLALAFDPFMQQIVSYPVRQVPSLALNATTKQAMLPFEPPTFGGYDNDFFNAMNAGLWSGGFTASADCPSGNCTWAPFTTAGWCSKCEDVTSSARLVGCDNVTFSATVTNIQLSAPWKRLLDLLRFNLVLMPV